KTLLFNDTSNPTTQLDVWALLVGTTEHSRRPVFVKPGIDLCLLFAERSMDHIQLQGIWTRRGLCDEVPRDAGQNSDFDRRRHRGCVVSRWARTVLSPR